MLKGAQSEIGARSVDHLRWDRGWEWGEWFLTPVEEGRLCARKGYLKEAGLGLGLQVSTAANQADRAEKCFPGRKKKGKGFGGTASLAMVAGRSWRRFIQKVPRMLSNAELSYRAPLGRFMLYKNLWLKDEMG